MVKGWLWICEMLTISKKGFTMGGMKKVICPECGETIDPRDVYAANEDGDPDWEKTVCPLCNEVLD